MVTKTKIKLRKKKYRSCSGTIPNPSFENLTGRSKDKESNKRIHNCKKSLHKSNEIHTIPFDNTACCNTSESLVTPLRILHLSYFPILDIPISLNNSFILIFMQNTILQKPPSIDMMHIVLSFKD